MINPFDFDRASYADLLEEAKRLNTELSTLQNKLMYVEKAYVNRERQVQDARVVVTEMIDENIITDENYIKALVEALDLEILREASFTITVEISGTVSLPLGSDLDEYSFDIDGLSYNGESVDYNQDSVSIDGWQFDE